MAKTELKNLSKEDLLRMLKEQEAEIGSLKEQIAELNTKLEEAQDAGISPDSLIYAQLENDGEKLYGSVAEASIKVNGVFEAAQRAADKYLDEIKNMHRLIAGANQKSEECARKKAEEIVFQAQLERERCEREKEEIVETAWNDIKARLENYYSAHKEIAELFGDKLDISHKEVQNRFGE